MRHAEGTFCWTDLGTSSRTGAAAFYAGLLGWQSEDAHLPEGIVYTLMKLGQGDAAGVYELDQEQLRQAVPPHWLLYIAVDDAEAKAARAKELGAKIVMEAYDVLDLGKMAILIDPTGALFALWEGKKRAGMSMPMGASGALSWCELMTPDVARAAEFYGALFAWEIQHGDGDQKSPGRYAELAHKGHAIAGLMAIGTAHKSVPAHWLVYFSVDDCDRSVAAAEASGGKALVPPTAVAGGETFAILRDPHGAVFGLITDQA